MIRILLVILVNCVAAVAGFAESNTIFQSSQYEVQEVLAGGATWTVVLLLQEQLMLLMDVVQDRLLSAKPTYISANSPVDASYDVGHRGHGCAPPRRLKVPTLNPGSPSTWPRTLQTAQNSHLGS